MRRLRRRIVSFALIAGAVVAPSVLASAGSASAAAWLPVQSLPTVPSDIAVDADGGAVVVGLGADNAIRATDRRFGVPGWTAPVVLEGTGDTLPSRPKVTVDGDGNAVAVWSATNAGERLIRVANRPAGGTWSTPAKLSTAEAGSQAWERDYALATDRQGTTTVVWTELDGSNYIVRTVSQAARRSWPAADAFPTTLTNSGEGTAVSPSVAVGDNGKVTIAWIGFEPGPGGSGVVNSVRSRSRDTSWGAWSTVHKITTGGLVETPTVASDPAGNTTLIWAQNAGGHVIRVARRPAGGSWTPAPGTDLGAGTEPQLAAASNGDLTAVWVAPDGGGEAIRARTSTDRGASWGPSADLATAPTTTALAYPQVAADAVGGATAIWGRFDGWQATAEVARRVAGEWTDEEDQVIGQLATYPVGAIDPKGHVTLAWTGPAALPGASSIFDPVGPELRDLVVPEVGVVGESVNVSVAPFDLTAVTTTWDFGNGAAAASAAAAHTYTAPGQYTVTVTGIDAAGNETQASRPITIVPRPVKGFPPPPEDVPGPKPNPVPMIKAPVLSGLQQTSVRWTTAKRRGSRVPVGTSFRFRLDRSAKVRLDFGQILPGRRSGKSCVKATKKNRSKRSCERVEARGTLNAFGKAGANGIDFRGKVGGRTLKPGHYRVQVTATADGKTSKAATKTFTIVR